MAAALVACLGRLARADEPLFGPPPRRTPIVIGLPSATEATASGEIAVVPNVRVTDAPPPGAKPKPPAARPPANLPSPFIATPSPNVIQTAAQLPLKATPVNQPLPPPVGPPVPDSRLPQPQPLAAPTQPTLAPPGAGAEPIPGGGVLPRVDPMFGQMIGDGCPPDGAPAHHHHHHGTFYGLGGTVEGDGDPGIGHERVMFAPYFIDITQPENNMRFRFQGFYNEHNPDRAEWFWAKTGASGPPKTEHSVDWQQATASWEVASGPAFSVTTDLPIQFVSPDVNATTAGLGDLTVTTKTVLLTGQQWQITQVFRVDTPTGDPLKGLGTGHVSLEPGFLFRYKWTPETYFHGELEYWFPIGANAIQEGQVFEYGFGISHLMYESDTYAIVPTLEFKGWSVMNGAQTVYPSGATQAVDTMGIFNVCPGVRFIYDTGGDLGLLEWGVASAFGITTNKWYDASVLIECRFVF